MSGYRLATDGFGDCVHVATCNLNQWALDFDGNLERTKRSIEIARSRGCRFRCGPELELSGYSCEDHFLEPDTFLHSWQSLVVLLQSGCTKDILCSVGMPIQHQGVSYNCAVWVLNGKILLLRPKVDLANDDNYREMRWFTGWQPLGTRASHVAESEDRESRKVGLERHRLPSFVTAALGQETVPFGTAVLECTDTVFASEMCQELFAPNSQNILLALNGAEILANPSGSHHSLRKLDQRVNLIENASRKSLCGYLYANHQGCDGTRLYFDGCSMVYSCGQMLAQATQFSVHDVEVIDTVIDLQQIRAMRMADATFKFQNNSFPRLPRVQVPFRACDPNGRPASTPTVPRYHPVEEEIAFGPACWCWDYLRRAGANGFYLPLSGGSDSASTAAIIGAMTHLLFDAIKGRDLSAAAQSAKEIAVNSAQVLEQVRKVVRDPKFTPKSPSDIAKRLFHTAYLGNSEVSGKATENRSKDISTDVGSNHHAVDILPMVKSMMATFKDATGKLPQFANQGGTNSENLALQNIQARLRMVFGYMLAQLLTLTTHQKEGWLIVLGSANVDEALTGYLTKYDCSSADINPIGGLCKMDLKRFLRWAHKTYGWQSMLDTVLATPTAELVPTAEDGVEQSDEADLGLTYPEMSAFGRIRKMQRAGPVSMYRKVLQQKQADDALGNLDEKKEATQPGGALGPPTEKQKEWAKDKVKNFYGRYYRNRHKMTVITPAYHAENYSPDDNRFDLRPFLYPWPRRQFETIDRMAKPNQGKRRPRLLQEKPLARSPL